MFGYSFIRIGLLPFFFFLQIILLAVLFVFVCVCLCLGGCHASPVNRLLKHVSHAIS